MAFFDRPIEELTQRYAEAFARNVLASTIKKYDHAILQRQFLDDVIAAWGVAFFASSVEGVIERLKLK